MPVSSPARKSRARTAISVPDAESASVADGAAGTSIPTSRTLRPAILWLDVRSEAEAHEMAARVGASGDRLAGTRVHAFYLGPKLAWLRRHEPARRWGACSC